MKFDYNTYYIELSFVLKIKKIGNDSDRDVQEFGYIPISKRETNPGVELSLIKRNKYVDVDLFVYTGRELFSFCPRAHLD